MSDSLVSRYFKSLPVVFPLIGLFHLVMTVFEAYYYVGDNSIHGIYWFRPLILLVYLVFWIGICLKKKWMAIGYLVLTMGNVAFHLFGSGRFLVHRALSDILFAPLPLNLVFCFLILFYFRRME